MSSRHAVSFGLRPVGPADGALLRAIYASTREEELAQVAWTDEQREAFLEQQFSAQDIYWAQQRPDTERSVILVDDEPAGRLYVDRTPEEIRIVDVALLPAFRNLGVGSALLRDLLSAGEQEGVPVTIHVEQFNPARALYERLGFTIVAEHGAYYLMER